MLDIKKIVTGVLAVAVVGGVAAMAIPATRNMILDNSAVHANVYKDLKNDYDNLVNSDNTIIATQEDNTQMISLFADGTLNNFIGVNGISTTIDYTKAWSDSTYLSIGSIAEYENYKLESEKFGLDQVKSVKVAEYAVINDAESDLKANVIFKLVDANGKVLEDTKNYGESTTTDVVLESVEYELYTAEEIEEAGGLEDETKAGAVKTATIVLKTSLVEITE